MASAVPPSARVAQSAIGSKNVFDVGVLEVVRLVTATLGLLTALIWLRKELHGPRAQRR